MSVRWWAVGAAVGVVCLLVGACEPGTKTAPPPAGNGTPTGGTPVPSRDAGTSVPDAGTSLPDAGTSLPDAGTSLPDAGTSVPDAGAWPGDALLDYTQRFGVGTPRSVGLDEGLNLWLLDGNRIGVLRPGDQAPAWATGLGQAHDGFGVEARALDSTVICGGEPGRAYVGYRTYELAYQSGIPQRTWIPAPGEPNYTPERYAEYQKGDLDAVRLQPDGAIALEEHIWRTPGGSNAGKQIGIHNTNDFHYDEDRSVLACARVTRGPYRGDLYIATNHGVTMVQGLSYNSHRHPAWYIDINGQPTLQAPPLHALGIAPNGDVLVANEGMAGIIAPDGKIEDWDEDLGFDGPVPWKFKGFNDVLGGGDYHYWRAFEQTTAGRRYLGSAGHGVWEMTQRSRTSADWSKLAGLPTDAILSMKATDDGALYIGTDGAGLWRLEPDGVALGRVDAIAGGRVFQFVYEPTVTPTMLLVLTERGLAVIRGP